MLELRAYVFPLVWRLCGRLARAVHSGAEHEVSRAGAIEATQTGTLPILTIKTCYSMRARGLVYAAALKLWTCSRVCSNNRYAKPS